MDEQINEIQETTTTTHFFISIAATLFVWFLFVKPITIRNPEYLMPSILVLWGLVFPLICLCTEAYKDSTTGEDDTKFVIIKFVSLMVALFAIHGFIIYYMRNTVSNKFYITMTVVLGLLLIANILEACFNQYNKYKEFEESVDLINFIIGLLLCISIVLNYAIPRKTMDIYDKKGRIFLKSNLNIWLILAYTFWNILFRSRLGISSVVLLFTVLTLIFPIITHLSGTGDWLHVRTISLLAYLILITGFSPGDGRILPMYNNQGYDQKDDINSPISKFQQGDAYNWTLLSLGGLTTIASIAHPLYCRKWS